MRGWRNSAGVQRLNLKILVSLLFLLLSLVLVLVEEVVSVLVEEVVVVVVVILVVVVGPAPRCVARRCSRMITQELSLGRNSFLRNVDSIL